MIRTIKPTLAESIQHIPGILTYRVVVPLLFPVVSSLVSIEMITLSLFELKEGQQG